MSSDAQFDATVTCTKGLENVFEEKYTGKKFNLTSEKFLGGASIIVSVKDGKDTLYQNEFAMGDNTDKPMTLHFLYTEIAKEGIVLKCSSFYPDSARGTLHLSFKDLKGKDYQEVISMLQEMGFTNIITDPLGDLKKGWIYDEGEVKEPEKC